MQHFDYILTCLAPELARMNAIIRTHLATPNALMNQIVESYLTVKGKQIRPVLVMLSAKFFGGVNEDTLHAGAALEMLHNASLIHDDVVDETTLRRGVPTINSLWGNHLAVLVGDFFVSNALAAGIRTGHLAVISALSELGKELSLGEVDQIVNARDHNLDEGSYIDMIRKKTASLFMNCVRMGAQTAGASEHEIEPMVKFAELLGIAFQIRDDIFDYYSDPRIGKPTGNDLREGKVTLPLLYALREENHEPEADRLRQLLRRGELTAGEISDLVEYAKTRGGTDYAFAYMRRLQQEGEKILARYPDSEWRRAFSELFEFIIARDR
ncbi:MAG: polyprenyl synthetase family protein [Muribaculaceae bacterium]|nr:polyprenyl synthetase family protein [Muribaculaceae bacterium]